VIIGRWRWRLSCLLAKAHQMPLASSDQFHLNTGHSLLPPFPHPPQRARAGHAYCITLDASALLTPRDRRYLPQTGEPMDAWNTLGLNN